jgi:DNA-directed RNA polymerase specialized sigma24 family protein
VSFPVGSSGAAFPLSFQQYTAESLLATFCIKKGMHCIYTFKAVFYADNGDFVLNDRHLRRSRMIDGLPALVWEEIYAWLRALVRRLVARFSVAAWRGQESDLIDDIVQETVRRFIERQPRVERGEAEPVYAPRQMLFTIAYNCCKDLYRRERRLIHTGGEAFRASNIGSLASEPVNLDHVVERVYQEELFALVAQEVARFPRKQQRALLIDLAELMSFDEEPSGLQEAFLTCGIDLRHYQNWPEDARAHEQRIALRNHAYKRLARLPSIRAFLEEREPAQAREAGD